MGMTMKNKSLLFKVIVLVVCTLWGNGGSLQASDSDRSFDSAKRRRVNSIPSEQKDDFLATTQAHLRLYELLPELWTHVFSFVAPADLISTRRVCRKFNKLACSDIFEYQLKLHYGVFTSYLTLPEHYAGLSFSKDGKKYESQKLVFVNNASVRDVEKFRLTRFNKRHYAAIFLKTENQSGVQILSCANGAKWEVITSREGVTLNDLQWISFREQLWLAYTSSDTFTLNFAYAENLKMGFQTNLQNIKSFSLVEFKDRLYMAYTTLASSDIYVASSGDGMTWDSHPTLGDTIKNLQLTSYQNKLRLVYANLKRSKINICSSEDGKSWSLDCVYTTFNNPEDLEVQLFRNELAIFYTCQGASTSRLIICSRDGQEWGEVSMLTLPQEVSSPKRGHLIRTK